MPDRASGKTRIAFVLPDFKAGGAQNVMLMLAGGLDRQKYDPAIVVFDGNGPWKERVPEGLDVVDLEKTSVRRAILALRKVLRERDPDVVLSTMGYVNLAVLLQKGRAEGTGRYVVREANALFPPGTGALKAVLLKRLYRWLYPRAERIIAPSERIADEFVSAAGFDRDAITVLRNPVEVEALRAAARPEKRVAGKGSRFVCVGRLTPQKAYDRLLGLVHDLDTPGHLTIFGEGPERATLEGQIESYGLQDRVTLAGFNANAAPWVAGADALLLPSLWEGLPNVALEALALGTPVIAAPEAGGIAEIAAAAPKGAVRVEAVGPEFARAMANTPRKQKAQMGRSLLPDVFHPETVHRAFERCLEAVLAGT